MVLVLSSACGGAGGVEVGFSSAGAGGRGDECGGCV